LNSFTLLRKPKQHWKICGWVTKISDLEELVSKQYLSSTLKQAGSAGWQANKLNLVLDLDGTLVQHIDCHQPSSHRLYLAIRYADWDYTKKDTVKVDMTVEVRQGAIEMINQLKSQYNISICSLATRHHIETIIQAMISNGLDPDAIPKVVSMLPMATANRESLCLQPNKQLSHVVPYASNPSRMNTCVIVDDDIRVWGEETQNAVYLIRRQNVMSIGQALPDCRKSLLEFCRHFFLAILSKVI